MTEAAPPPSMESGTLRARYQAVETHARFMLAAARVSDWPLFWQLETECAGLVRELKACPAHPEDGAWAADRHDLLLRMLRTDARIRELLQSQAPRLASLASHWVH